MGFTLLAYEKFDATSQSTTDAVLTAVENQL